MGMIQEFKEFAVKGNVADMAVGVIIGASFGKVVSSMVGDLFMPPLGMLIGGVNFTNFKLTLKDAAENVPAVTLNYGMFLQTLFDFVIVAFALFLVIKAMNTLKRKGEQVPSAPPADVVLLAEIRDLLKSQR